MKTFCFLVMAAAAMGLVGCGKEPATATKGEATNAAAPGSSPLTAPVDYLDAVGKGQRTATKTIDTAALNKAIELFHVEQGRYPRDLKELVEEKFLSAIPAPPAGMELAYDAATGKARVVPR